MLSVESGFQVSCRGLGVRSERLIPEHFPECPTELYRSPEKNQKPVCLSPLTFIPFKINTRMKPDNHFHSITLSDSTSIIYLHRFYVPYAQKFFRVAIPRCCCKLLLFHVWWPVQVLLASGVHSVLLFCPPLYFCQFTFADPNKWSKWLMGISCFFRMTKYKYSCNL